MKHIADWALNLATLRGASYADARVVDERSRAFSTKNGKVGGAADSESFGIGIRVIAQGAWGFAASDDLSRGAVETTAAQAVEIAKASARVKQNDIRLAPEKPVTAEWVTPHQIDPFSISVEQNLELLLKIDAELRSVVGVSPAIDLGLSATALHLPQNRLYERRFLRNLIRRFRRKVRLFPRAFDPNRATGIRSLREFDDRITALYSGFASAEDYYFRAAAARVVDRIAVPTLIVHALDDPFIHIAPETIAKIAANPHITFVQTKHGGHCAFLTQPDRAIGDDGRWAETTLLRFILAHA